MTAPLLLAAAGGLARETLAAVRAQGRYEPIGVLDDDPGKHGLVLDGVKVIGPLAAAAEYPDAAVVLCAGKGAARAAMAASLGLPGVRYASVIHPSVAVAPSCEIGTGSILLAGCVLTASVTIGRHVVAMPNVVLTHDDVVDDYATLCAGVVLGGAVRIGTSAYVGMAASIREGVVVGAGSVVGMGAVVLADVPDHETCFGVPARSAVARNAHRRQFE
jgi:sugar O-acyltransferase (sialic acid O-acetyltransferase NeuD family)